MRPTAARARLGHESEAMRKKKMRKEGLVADNMGPHGNERKRKERGGWRGEEKRKTSGSGRGKRKGMGRGKKRKRASREKERNGPE